MRSITSLALVSCWLGVALDAYALPQGPATFCDTYPEAPACAGATPACQLCHVAAGPPARNPFGACVEAVLLPGAPRPLVPNDFVAALGAALPQIEADDCDGDGVANLDEILAGTYPGDAASFPENGDCPGLPNPDYAVCEYDPRYTYKKVFLDFCGHSPTFEQVEQFAALAQDEQQAALHDVLDACLDSEFWLGKDGVVWSLAHKKIRPVQSLKGGLEDAGSLPVLGDYYDDYQLFVYSQIDDHDARDVLLARYYVTRHELNGETSYSTVANKCTVPCGLNLDCQFDCLTGNQLVPDARRVGMMSTRWNLLLNTMFSDVPRTTAAQAYRAFLGLDIAKSEGLQPVDGEPVDYDNKGVDRQECAVCHSTLDPLTYPFTTYGGFDQSFATYNAGRMAQRGYPNVPESGIIFGQPVANLLEWADVAANSDAFAVAASRDYWTLLMNRAPTEDEQEEFTTLWQTFAGAHNFGVERMLHDFIETEAYGAP